MERNPPHLVQCRLGIAGVPGIGKSALLWRYIHDSFIEEYDPTIEDREWIRSEIIEDTQFRTVVLGKYDWKEDQTSILDESTIKQCDAVLIAYSCTSRYSFDNLDRIRMKVLELTEKKDLPIILIETQNDKENERVIPKAVGEEMAKLWKTRFISTNAKTDRTSAVLAVRELLSQFKEYQDHNSITKKGKKVKKKIHNRATPSLYSSVLHEDIMNNLFNNSDYADIIFMTQDIPIYAHKIVLFSRFPSFMEHIKPTDMKIVLEPNITPAAMLSILQYVYTGKFQRNSAVTNEEYLAAIKRWEVFTLLPILKKEPVEEIPAKFERLFNLNFSSDIKFIVQEPEKTEEIFCHQVILAARNKLFKQAFQRGLNYTNQILIDDCSYQAVKFFLEYFYLDQMSITDESIVLEVLKLAHLYKEINLIRAVEVCIANKLTVENVCTVVLLCRKYNLVGLELACEEFISYRFDKVCKTSTFKKLDAETQLRYEGLKKEGPWETPKSGEDTLTKMLKNFKI